MHLPDHVLDPSTLAVGTGIAVVGLVGALRSLDPAEARARLPLAGAVTAFVFAAQMLNVEALPGVSVHVIGAVLGAWLLGPALGFLATSAVLIVQALLFGDGGIAALGVNALVMAGVGSLLVVAARRLLEASGRAGSAAWSVGAAGAAGLIAPAASASLLTMSMWSTFPTPAAAAAFAAPVLGANALAGLIEGAATVLVLVTLIAVSRMHSIAIRATVHESTASAGVLGAFAVMTAGASAAFASVGPDALQSALRSMGIDPFGSAAMTTLPEVLTLIGGPEVLAGILGAFLAAGVAMAGAASRSSLASLVRTR